MEITDIRIWEPAGSSMFNIRAEVGGDIDMVPTGPMRFTPEDARATAKAFNQAADYAEGKQNE